MSDQQQPCAWREDEDGNWQTACGREWTFFDAGPTENRVKFCIECGKPVVAVQFTAEPEDADE